MLFIAFVISLIYQFYARSANWYAKVFSYIYSMRSIAFLLTLLLISLSLCAQKKIKVLFIGNSYTYVNNLPQAIHDLALANGDTLIFSSSTPGGYTFQQQSAYAPTLSLIAQGGWDYVVLQDQSEEPSFPPSQVQTDVYPYARTLDSLIHAADSCTETVFYMTWGHQNGDPSNCAGYPQICTYSGMQDRLTQSYLEMGQLVHATVAPAGEAWRKIVSQYHPIDLYQSDSSHPTIWGTYLTASVFYEILFQKNVVGDTFITAGIADSNALQLREAAHSIVADSLSKWLGNGHIPVASFTYSTSGAQVSFTSGSINGETFSWSFGDNTTGSGSSLSHTYSTSGTYPVTLTVHDHCKTSVFSDSITVIVASGISEQKKPTLNIYPNPASEVIHIDMSDLDLKNSTLILSNVYGQIVRKVKPLSLSTEMYIAGLSSGIYTLSLKTETDSISYRISIK